MFINFCLLRIICCASYTKLRSWLESSALAFIQERRFSSLAFTSNCFLLPLNLNTEADLSIFDWSSIRFLWASSGVLRYPLNKENTTSTNSELWGLWFAEGSFSFVPLRLAPYRTSLQKTNGKHVGNWNARERKNAFYVNEFMALINQSESASESCKNCLHTSGKYIFWWHEAKLSCVCVW